MPSDAYILLTTQELEDEERTLKLFSLIQLGKGLQGFYVVIYTSHDLILCSHQHSIGDKSIQLNLLEVKVPCAGVFRFVRQWCELFF